MVVSKNDVTFNCGNSGRVINKANYEPETCNRTLLHLISPYRLSLVRQQVVDAVRADGPSSAVP